jgi:hypothetical protein
MARSVVAKQHRFHDGNTVLKHTLSARQNRPPQALQTCSRKTNTKDNVTISFQSVLGRKFEAEYMGAKNEYEAKLILFKFPTSL